MCSVFVKKCVRVSRFTDKNHFHYYVRANNMSTYGVIRHTIINMMVLNKQLACRYKAVLLSIDDVFV